MKIYLAIIVLVILSTTSCAQKSKPLSKDFKTIIYDTYHMMGENLVPKEYWYSMDKYLKLNRDVDSVLFVRIIGEIDDRKEIPKDEKAQRIRLEDLHSCSSLGFFEFKSISIGKNSQGLIDFKNFPELRYVHNLEHLKHLWIQGAFPQIDSIPKGIESLPSLESLELHGFGFSYNNNLSKRINKYNHSSHFGGEFDKTFDYYKWLFIFGKPSKYIKKMY